MSEILEVPNSWNAGIITNKGLGLLSKLVKGHTLSITRAETGAGFVDPELLAQQTAVTQPMQALTFNAVSYPEEGKCVIPCKLTNEEITTSYIARQIGVYAIDPDEGEILFYITQVDSEDGGTGIPAKNLIPSYTSTWNLVILYGMADGVELKVDPAGMVTHGELDSALATFANKVGSAIIREVTIPVDGWKAAGDNAIGDYIYTAEVAIEGTTDKHFPVMALDILSLDPAADAELSPTIETLEGIVRFWAKVIPASDLKGSILLRSENMVDADIATDEEVKDTVDDVFGETGGTASDYEVATDEEAAAIIKNIFG